MFKSFTPREFNSLILQELTGVSEKDDGTLEPPVEEIFQLLQSHGCQSILVEDRYIDKDFKSEFSAVYSKHFRTISNRCIRLHFFKCKLPKTEQPDLPKPDYGKCSKGDYLGYMIVRPTEFNRVGRTVLPPPLPDSKKFVTCRSTFSAHIFGEKFEVSGMPFIQQDTQVGVCAHAALWMVGRYLSCCGHSSEFLPEEINCLAKARLALGRVYPAEHGLTHIQMLDALQGMGLSTIHYQKNYLGAEICKHLNQSTFLRDGMGEQEITEGYRNSLKLADLAYRYIESGLPVLFLTENHAFVGIGYVTKENRDSSNTIENTASFLINDDAGGPYVELPLFGQNKFGNSFLNVKQIIIVTPQAASLCGSDAEEGVRAIIEDLGKELLEDNSRSKDFCVWLSQNQRKFGIRTHLLSATELQRDFRRQIEEDNFSGEFGRQLIERDYPKYVWISELYDISGKYVGRAIVDSTAAKRDRMTMVILLREICFMSDRQEYKVSIHSLPSEFASSQKSLNTQRSCL